MRAISLIATFVCAASAAHAQDVVKSDPQHNTVEFENDEVRVIRFKYAPGEKSPMHEHPRNVIVWLTDAKYTSTNAEGKTGELDAKKGQALWRPAVKHVVENVGPTATEGIMVEMKTKPPKAAAKTAALKK